ncbi:hypothetical protein EG68_03220 [Paragonimus skrjabini miyazakii]|uniref:Uncharacterized protein n=1 Tax=Paragonimus skrjabini miyazakii TaxID=59628 RepID=A0A8S9YWJ0_9TREM|nr:hypothetical protein EG68_03220 [Paragonimus skrjabini miyazakii]
MNWQEKADGLFSIFLWLTLAALITNFVSFVSPYWIQSIPEAHSQFERIGLWTACFNGYMRPNDFNKAYFGCYYIYFVEYDNIRDWINPIWLYAVQALSSSGMLMQSLVAFVVLCQATRSIDRGDLKVTKFNLVGHFYTCTTLAASLVAFAVARYDSTWMPYPQFNVLSWSYAVAAASFALTLIAFIVEFLRYLYLDAIFEEHNVALLEHQEEMGKSSPPMKAAMPYVRDDQENFPLDVNDAPEDVDHASEFRSDLMERDRFDDADLRYSRDSRNFEPHKSRLSGSRSIRPS